MVLSYRLRGPSGSPVDGRSRQVDVLPDRVSGNTRLLGDAPQGDTLQPGVVDCFPKGLLARRCLPGRGSVRGGDALIRRRADRRSQGGQALRLQPGETMPLMSRPPATFPSALCWTAPKGFRRGARASRQDPGGPAIWRLAPWVLPHLARQGLWCILTLPGLVVP